MKDDVKKMVRNIKWRIRFLKMKHELGKFGVFIAGLVLILWMSSRFIVLGLAVWVVVHFISKWW